MRKLWVEWGIELRDQWKGWAKAHTKADSKAQWLQASNIILAGELVPDIPADHQENYEYFFNSTNYPHSCHDITVHSSTC